MKTSSRQAAKEYLDLDFEAIPLKPNSKEPLLAGWQNADPSTQWEKALENSNIGLRCGGTRRLGVFDSDDKKSPTWPNVYRYLCGLGIEPGSYPVIATPNNGRHAYLELVGSLSGNIRLFKKEFGAGELRYGPGAYVVSPPSEIINGCYTRVEGDLRELPKVEAKDIIAILENSDLSVSQKIDYHKPSRRALALLQGRGIDDYLSRSEAEQAILTCLANSDFGFGEVLQLFIQYPAAGKFQELYTHEQKAGIRWLSGSFRKAQKWAKTNESPARKKALTALEWAKSKPWPGKTGSNDKAVFIAHATIAYNAGRFDYNASARQLADLAGISPEAAINATRRLCCSGLLVLVRVWVADCANIYRLKSQSMTLPQYTL
jgi:hypothetical protein